MRSSTSTQKKIGNLSTNGYKWRVVVNPFSKRSKLSSLLAHLKFAEPALRPKASGQFGFQDENVLRTGRRRLFEQIRENQGGSIWWSASFVESIEGLIHTWAAFWNPMCRGRAVFFQNWCGYVYFSPWHERYQSSVKHLILTTVFDYKCEPSNLYYIHPWKLTWNPNMKIWKMMFLFKQVIF